MTATILSPVTFARSFLLSLPGAKDVWNVSFPSDPFIRCIVTTPLDCPGRFICASFAIDRKGDWSCALEPLAPGALRPCSTLIRFNWDLAEIFCENGVEWARIRWRTTKAFQPKNFTDGSIVLFEFVFFSNNASYSWSVCNWCTNVLVSFSIIGALYGSLTVSANFQLVYCHIKTPVILKRLWPVPLKIFFNSWASIDETTGLPFAEIVSLLDSMDNNTFVGCMMSFRKSAISFCPTNQKYVSFRRL